MIEETMVILLEATTLLGQETLIEVITGIPQIDQTEAIPLLDLIALQEAIRQVEVLHLALEVAEQQVAELEGNSIFKKYNNRL